MSYVKGGHIYGWVRVVQACECCGGDAYVQIGGHSRWTEKRRYRTRILCEHCRRFCLRSVGQCASAVAS